MKYTTANELLHFEYHDAVILKVERHDADMVWTVKHLNATTENSQNQHSTDMCIKEAQIVFEAAEISGIEFINPLPRRSADQSVYHEAQTTSDPCECWAILHDTLESPCCIYALTLISDAQDDMNGGQAISITINGMDVYDLTIHCSSVLISWDEFDGKAWYVNGR